MSFDIYSKDGADDVFVRTVNSTGPDEAGNVVVSGGGAVDSVNGQTGEVVLDSGDIGAAPAPTGTPDGTKFYRDDGTWATPAGGGGGSVVVVVGDTTTPITDPNTARPTADWVLWYADGVHPVNALDIDLIIRVDEDVFDGGIAGSLEIVGGALQLAGDEVTPGANEVYGTNGAGVKGWKADPAGADPRRHPIPPSAGQYLSLPVARGTEAGADGNCRLCPVYFPQEQTITAIGIDVTTAAASSVVRLGLYADNNGVPDALILDAGTVDSSTTGAKAIAISQTVGPGMVWFAVATQGGGPTLRSYTALPNFTQRGGTLAQALGTAPRLGEFKSGVTGALPSPFAGSGLTLPGTWAVAWTVAS